MTLSRDEQLVLDLWAQGRTKAAAYEAVMLKDGERKKMKPASFSMRVHRFFDNQRMQRAMAERQAERDRHASAKRPRKKDIEPDEPVQEVETPRTLSEAQRLLDSLKLSDEPAALSVYGSGLFLAHTAIEQITKRKKEIEKLGLSPLDPQASPYSSQDIAALRTAATMILPYAPAATSAERKAMTLASVLVGLSEAEVQEKPDDYTAPPPAGVVIDVGGE